MKRRCYVPGSSEYERYGARGITVCARWRKSFRAFVEDMGLCQKGRSLDRHPNNNGNYKPENCRWATPAEQSRNKRNNVLITHRGTTLCAKDWADRIGMKPNTLIRRLLNGWHEIAALETPLKARREARK